MFLDDEPVTVRPARPEDAGRIGEYIRGLSFASRYTRFLGPVNELTPRNRVMGMRAPLSVKRGMRSTASAALSVRATVDIEVREISPPVSNFGFVLDAREHHLAPGNLPPRIGDERCEAGPILDEACVLHGGGY
jgi:hypothetical protein